MCGVPKSFIISSSSLDTANDSRTLSGNDKVRFENKYWNVSNRIWSRLTIQYSSGGRMARARLDKYSFELHGLKFGYNSVGNYKFATFLGKSDVVLLFAEYLNKFKV